jgi:hypothetical protein
VPLGAGSSVTHGVGDVVTENHLNETAPSGYVARLVVLGEFMRYIVYAMLFLLFFKLIKYYFEYWTWLRFATEQSS